MRLTDLEMKSVHIIKSTFGVDVVKLADMMVRDKGWNTWMGIELATFTLTFLDMVFKQGRIILQDKDEKISHK